MTSASVPACRSASLKSPPWIPSMDCDYGSISQTSPFLLKWLLVMAFTPVTAGKLGPLQLDFGANNKIKF